MRFFSTGAWGVVAAAVMIAWLAASHLKADRAPDRDPFKTIYGATPAEESQLGALLGEAFGVLRSDRFRDNLESLGGRYPVIYAKADDQEATPAKLASVIGLDGMFTRFAPANVVLEGGADPKDPTRDNARAGEGVGRYSEITIGRNVLQQFRIADLVAQSCAVNVAAHEYAHTLSTTPMGFGIAFTDTTDAKPKIEGRQHPGTPVASYLIGAVAQCTWLQFKGRIGRDDVPACVEVFGVNAMNWARCIQFQGGEPVALRPGLAQPSPSL